MKFVFPADENNPEAIDALGRHMHQNLRVRILAAIYNLFLLCIWRCDKADPGPYSREG